MNKNKRRTKQLKNELKRLLNRIETMKFRVAQIEDEITESEAEGEMENESEESE